MSFRLPLILVVALSTAVGFAACKPHKSGAGGGGATATGGTGSMSTASGTIAGLTAIEIAPVNVTLEVGPTKAASQAYTAKGTINGTKMDISSLVSWSIADSSLGSFSGGTLTNPNPNHGGTTTVTATANSDMGPISATTNVTFHFTAAIKGPDNGMPLPADPSKNFAGSPKASLAPQLVYPNDGVMVPPNLHRLEVHWRPGAATNTLFQIDFASPVADIKTFLRCTSPTNGGCIFELDPVAYQYISDSDAGGPATKLTVSGSDDAGTGFGTSTAFSVKFASEPVQGGLYYWTTTNGTAIMRFDFGGTATMPSVFLSPSQNGFPTCVGCHALSRDGSKMVSSLGGQNDGRIVYLNDLTKPNNFALNGDATNHIQFASFNDAGDRFVSVYGDSSPPERNTLFFHDGNTGQRIVAESIVLPFEPDHPDWSPDGTMIAIDHVGIHQTSQRPFNCNLEILKKNGASWGAPDVLVPNVSGKSRYNANFAPDSSFVVYSESTCPGGVNTDAGCDGDADPSAKTWAVQAKAGSTPILLGGAAKGGVDDMGATDLSDTFPRFSPFSQKEGTGRVFWATISSRRKLGLRDPAGHQLLWMFAIDPDKILAGQDGTSAAFFLPFQDLTTSNHIAQWTHQIVTPQ